jgi:flagellin
MTRILTTSRSLIPLYNLQKAQTRLGYVLTQLVTGLRINAASDDPAGLIASEALRAQITESDAAMKSNDRTARMVSTADSALAQMSEVIGDIRGLAVASVNSGALSPDQIKANQVVIDAAVDAVNRIAGSTNFAGKPILDGSLTIRISPDGQAMTIPAVNAATLGQTASAEPGATDGQTLASVRSGGANSLANGGAAAIAAIATTSASQIAVLRGKLGAFQKYGLEGTNRVLADARLNGVAAWSQIVDADMAQAVSQFGGRRVALQSSLMALAKAQQYQRGLLDLIA